MPLRMTRPRRLNRYRRLALLTVSLTLLLAGVTGCGLTQTQQPQATQAPTVAASATAAANVVDGISFKTITDPTFGFHLDIPADMVENGSQPDPTDGGGITAFNGAYPTAQDALGLQISTATNGLPSGSCNSGTPITVGSGLRGYEQDIFAQPTPVPQPNSGAVTSSVVATVVANGLFVAIRLNGMPPDDTFMQRYGVIWQHILASFTPGTFVNPRSPCGS